ncbi:MAG: hypothetical protein Q9172_002794 [Xanthocarpia lactea]
MGGERIRFLTSAADVATVCKNTSAFVFDRVVYELCVRFGVSRAAAEKIHTKPTSQETDIVAKSLQIQNRQLKALHQLNGDFFKQQLHAGEHYDYMLDKYTKSFESLLRPKHLCPTLAEKEANKEKHVSLIHWTRDNFMEVSTEILFGEKIKDTDPDLIQNFLAFDDENWKLWYKWPGGGAMQKAKEKVIGSLERYLKWPRGERAAAAYLMQMIENSQRALDISDRDIATNLMMMYWAATTNSWKLCFWAFAYIMYTPGQLDVIRKEVNMAFDASDQISHQHLSSACPMLDATLSECLRLCNANSSIRIVQESITVGGKNFHPGDRVVCPSRELHSNADIYGPDPSVFDPNRFIRDKTLLRSIHYRPFGSGILLCPGRFIARQTVKVFIALVLHRFEIGLDGEQAFPAKEETKPATGLMSPAQGQDILMRIRVSGSQELGDKNL